MDLEREIGDLVPRRENGEDIPLTEDLGRQFLYARFNAELSDKWLNSVGLPDVDPAKVAQLDSVEHIDDLIRVGKAVGRRVKREHFVLERFGQFYF
jgi:hypothetical protein